MVEGVSDMILARIVRAVVVPLMLSLLILPAMSLFDLPVHAASQNRSTTAPMTVRCTGLTEEQRKIVVEKGLCRSVTTDPGGVLSNGDPVEGNCGSSQLNLSQAGPNTTRANQRLLSSQGPIIYVNDSINVSNTSSGGTTILSWNRPAFGSVFEDSQNAYTGSGSITGRLSGTATVQSGATTILCDVGPAFDYTVIT